MQQTHRGDFNFDPKESTWPDEAFPNVWDYDNMSHVCLWASNDNVVDLNRWNLWNTTYCVVHPIDKNTNNQLLHGLMNNPPGVRPSFRTRTRRTRCIS